MYSYTRHVSQIISPVNLVFSTAGTLFPVYKRPMKHALRQTTYLPNQRLLFCAVYLRRKLTFTAIFVGLPVDHSTHALCLNLVKLIFLYFGQLQLLLNPYNYVAALVIYRTRCYVRGLRQWEYEWHCHRISMPNIVGGARTCTFFKLASRWRSELYSVHL